MYKWTLLSTRIHDQYNWIQCILSGETSTQSLTVSQDSPEAIPTLIPPRVSIYKRYNVQLNHNSNSLFPQLGLKLRFGIGLMRPIWKPNLQLPQLWSQFHIITWCGGPNSQFKAKLRLELGMFETPYWSCQDRIPISFCWWSHITGTMCWTFWDPAKPSYPTIDSVTNPRTVFLASG